jgi:hypothetical protein
MNKLLPVLSREMRCKPPNAEIQHKNVRGHICYFENITNYHNEDLNHGKIRLHINEDEDKIEGQQFVYFIKQELVDFEIEECQYNNPIVDPGPEVFFDYALLKLRVELAGSNDSIGNIATNIRLVDNDKKEKKERKKRVFK